ncbi:hypothetical protein B0H16DRAFT_1298458 [Mycena metata]|uniref:DUF7719 domain-containing protein n=1 Tax=Mycena metata TaxID=1033252 RepID=A0AAD7KA21_9AGAR|nr:hypothetical protein B0H16DRAFT_1298458 [Mycena metata]
MLSSTESSPAIDIPQDEQWRLIKESGVLKQVDPVEPELPLGEGSVRSPPRRCSLTSHAPEIFNAVLLITPFSFLLVLMEILVYNQYGQEVNLKTVADRMISGIPILSVFIFYTSRYKKDRRVQRVLFLMGTAAGSRMLFVVQRGSYLLNMQQCPPLITLWVYIVVQLDLGLAVLNLAAVGIFVWWKQLF